MHLSVSGFIHYARMSKYTKLPAVALSAFALFAVGACKDKASDGQKAGKAKAKQPAANGTRPAAPNKSSPQPILNGYRSLDVRPGPRHAERSKVADKLEQCLLTAAAPGSDCYVDTVRAQLVDSDPAIAASGKDAFIAWHASGFGLGLSELSFRPMVTMVKGKESLLMFHMRGTVSGGLLAGKGKGEPVALVAALYVRYDRDHKIVEVQAYMDQLSALGQVGGTQLAHRPAAPEPKDKPARGLASGFGSEAKNLQKLQYVTDELDEHNPELMSRYYAADSVLSRLWQPADFTGQVAITESYGVEFKGSSNSRYAVKWEWVAQDHVAMLIERSGSSTGPLFGTDTKTDRSYTVQELHVMRLRDGLLNRHWVFVNGLQLARQIGLEK